MSVAKSDSRSFECSGNILLLNATFERQCEQHLRHRAGTEQNFIKMCADCGQRL